MKFIFYAKRLIISAVPILLFNTCLYSTGIDITMLEKKVYELNNDLRFEDSQKLLFETLNNKELSSDETYHVYIQLSYTYKRLFDYESTIKFLHEAQKSAILTDHKIEYGAHVKSELALAYFDIHEYAKADEAMRLLVNSNYQYILPENKAKLIMQQAYLYYLKKEYEISENMYNQSLSIMKVACPCEQPLVLVKRMQLYADMGNMVSAESNYMQALYLADSCDIVKYSLYAKDELSSIYKSRKEYEKAARINNELDSLHTIYDKDKHLVSLYAQKELYHLQNKDKLIDNEKRTGRFLLWGILLFAMLFFFAIIWNIRSRKQKRDMEKEFNIIKSELQTYMKSKHQSSEIAEDTEKIHESVLTTRQLEVLNLLYKGYTNKEIGTTLFISENTVKYHIKLIYQILDVKDRKDLLMKK